MNQVDQQQKSTAEDLSGLAFTPEAAERAVDLSARSKWQNKVLRLYIDGKGCEGFHYGVTFDDRRADDLSFPVSGKLEIAVDPETYSYTRGSTISWVDDERGMGFLVDNPRHKYFRGKFFKRPNWQGRHGITVPDEKSNGN